MRRDTLNFRQALACVILFVLGSSLVTGGDRSAGRDTWMVVLAVAALTVPLGLLYTRITRLYPEKDIYEALRHVFGKALGNLCIVVLCAYFLHLYGLILCNFGVYAAIVSLPQTNDLLIMLPVALLSCYLVSKGIQVIGRVALFLFVYVLLYFAINIISAHGYFHYENLLPMMHRPVSDFAESALSQFSFPFAETVALMAVLGAVRQGTSRFRVFASGVLIAGGIFAYTILRNILMLGETIYVSNYYPSVIAISLITVGRYLQHIEMIVSFTMLFCILMKSTVCLYNVQLGLQAMLAKKPPKWLMPALALLSAAGAILLIPTPQAIKVFAKNVYPLYALPIQVGLPVLFWIAAEVKKRRETGHPGT